MKSIYKSAQGECAVRERYIKFLQYWPVPNRQLRIPTREGETFVVECGPEGAPALILLHGANGNAAMWMADVAAWAEHFRVFAVDVIGDAGLSAPSRPPLASDAHALWRWRRQACEWWLRRETSPNSKKPLSQFAPEEAKRWWLRSISRRRNRSKKRSQRRRSSDASISW